MTGSKSERSEVEFFKQCETIINSVFGAALGVISTIELGNVSAFDSILKYVAIYTASSIFVLVLVLASRRVAIEIIEFPEVSGRFLGFCAMCIVLLLAGMMLFYLVGMGFRTWGIAFPVAPLTSIILAWSLMYMLTAFWARRRG